MRPSSGSRRAARGVAPLARRGPAGSRPPRPSDELVKVLAMQPTSGSFAARPAQPLAPVGTTTVSGPMGSLAARQLAQSLGVTWFRTSCAAVFAQYQRALPDQQRVGTGIRSPRRSPRRRRSTRITSRGWSVRRGTRSARRGISARPKVLSLSCCCATPRCWSTRAPPSACCSVAGWCRPTRGAAGHIRRTERTPVDAASDDRPGRQPAAVGAVPGQHENATCG